MLCIALQPYYLISCHSWRKPEVLTKFPRGVLYRTGPGGYRVTDNRGTKVAVSHWFDAFAQTHRFNIVSPTKVLYNSRFTCDGLLNQVRETGRLPSGYSFAQRDPCQSFFRKFMATFTPRVDLVSGSTTTASASKANVGVTISTNFPGLPADAEGKSLYTKTDATSMQSLDPETLEPIGLANQAVLHPKLTGPLSSAHSRSDPLTGDVFNYNLTLGSKNGLYHIFQVIKATGKTEILATITDAPGAYIHSFFLTPRYVILCVWGAYYAHGGLKMLYHKNILDAIEPFNPTEKNRWYVIDRTNARRGVISSHTSDGFFAFHSVNAWEEGDDVVAEIPIYKDTDILKKFYVNHLKSDEKSARKWVEKGRGNLTRWRIKTSVNNSEAVKEFEVAKDLTMELPTINPQFVTLPHRLVFILTVPDTKF